MRTEIKKNNIYNDKNYIFHSVQNKLKNKVICFSRENEVTNKEGRKEFSTNNRALFHTKEILCFGDSNTYGLIPKTLAEKKRAKTIGASAYERYPYGVRWTSILQEKLGKGYHVSEEGLCGRTTIFQDATRAGRKGTELFPTLLETHGTVDIAVIMLGTNDCKIAYQATPAKIASGIEELVMQAKAHNPSIEILIVSPIFLGEGVGETDYDPEFGALSVWHSRQLASEYRKVALKHHCHFLAASDYASPSAADREHMNEEGHLHLAEAIFERLHAIEEQRGMKHVL